VHFIPAIIFLDSSHSSYFLIWHHEEVGAMCVASRRLIIFNATLLLSQNVIPHLKLINGCPIVINVDEIYILTGGSRVIKVVRGLETEFAQA
jgi:hypothetical protein